MSRLRGLFELPELDDGGILEDDVDELKRHRDEEVLDDD